MGDDYRKFVKAETIDQEHGLVIGWAMVCKVDGQDYWDVQDNHIPEPSMLDALVDFAEHSRMAKEMHSGDAQAEYIFMFPMTGEIAKALGIATSKTGALVGYKPPPDVLAKFKDGTYTGFSIGGHHLDLRPQ